MKKKWPGGSVAIDTCHAALGLDEDPINAAYALWPYTMVVIDEISLLNDKQFEHVDKLHKYIDRAVALIVLGDRRQMAMQILDVASDTAHPMQGPATEESAGSGSFAECAVTQQEPDDDLPATPTEPSPAEDAQPRSHAADGEGYGEYFDDASDYAMLHGSGSDHPSACCVVHPPGKDAGPLQGDDIHKGA